MMKVVGNATLISLSEKYLLNLSLVGSAEVCRSNYEAGVSHSEYIRFSYMGDLSSVAISADSGCDGFRRGLSSDYRTESWLISAEEYKALKALLF